MGINFSMDGMSLLLILGILLVLSGLHMFILLQPIKRRNSFRTRDYILLGITACIAIAGIVCLVIGIIKAIPLLA